MDSQKRFQPRPETGGSRPPDLNQRPRTPGDVQPGHFQQSGGSQPGQRDLPQLAGRRLGGGPGKVQTGHEQPVSGRTGGQGGEFIADVTAKTSIQARTLESYAQSFRKIVADIHSIDGGKAKYDYATGGRQKWLDRINAVSLSSLTPDAIQKWKLDFLHAAGHSSSLQRAARTTVNALRRNARSLFSPKLLKFVRVKLPDPLPFSGVQFEPRSSTRVIRPFFLSKRTLQRFSK
jgi:hypothetical protein